MYPKLLCTKLVCTSEIYWPIQRKGVGGIESFKLLPEQLKTEDNNANNVFRWMQITFLEASKSDLKIQKQLIKLTSKLQKKEPFFVKMAKREAKNASIWLLNSFKHHENIITKFSLLSTAKSYNEKKKNWWYCIETALYIYWGRVTHYLLFVQYNSLKFV